MGRNRRKVVPKQLSQGALLGVQTGAVLLSKERRAAWHGANLGGGTTAEA